MTGTLNNYIRDDSGTFSVSSMCRYGTEPLDKMIALTLYAPIEIKVIKWWSMILAVSLVYIYPVRNDE